MARASGPMVRDSSSVMTMMQNAVARMTSRNGTSSPGANAMGMENAASPETGPRAPAHATIVELRRSEGPRHAAPRRPAKPTIAKHEQPRA